MSTLQHSAATNLHVEDAAEAEPAEHPKLNWRADGPMSRRIRMHAAAKGKTPGRLIWEILDGVLPEYELKEGRA